MLKRRELKDCEQLYPLLCDPAIFPFVRQKAQSYEEYLFLTKHTLEEEENGNTISRTIVDEWNQPIGTISLFDIEDGAGFLGTWIGKPYHGKGYNRLAKDAFFDELFYDLDITTVYMRIRKLNIRSKKAAEKLPYVVNAAETHPSIYEAVNAPFEDPVFDLYMVPKDLYVLHTKRVDRVEVVLAEDRLEA